MLGLRLRSGILPCLLIRHVTAYKTTACRAKYRMPLSDEVATDAANNCALQTSRGLCLSRGRNSQNSYGNHQCFFLHFAFQY
jgi:hypothetical protein